MARYMDDNGLDATSTFTRVAPKVRDANRAANLRLYTGGPSMEEFPFASTAQGGPGAHLTQVSIDEQRAQGRLLWSFYRQNVIQPGDPFGIWIDWNFLMPQILDYFIEPAYGQVCLSDQDAELSWQATFNDQHVASDETTITIAVTDEEPERQVEVEVYQGDDGKPALQYLQRIFDGVINLTRTGLLIFAPTGDEVLLEEIADGPHQIKIYRDSYPTLRLVVLIDTGG